LQLSYNYIIIAFIYTQFPDVRDPLWKTTQKGQEMMLMKKGNLVALAGLLILLFIFGYSYYANKPTLPSAEEKIPQSLNLSTDNEAGPTPPAAEAINQASKNGESMWLLFRSATCDPCIEMQKVFDQLEPEYRGKMVFIAIDVNDSNNQDLLRSFGIRYIPTTFIVDRSGKITYQNVGVIPTDDLKKELNKVVK